MTRRRAIVLSAAGLWAAAATCAQGTRRTPVVGWLGLASASGDRETLVAFRSGMRALGYQEGNGTFVLEVRHAGGDPRRAEALIAELVAQQGRGGVAAP